MSRYLLLLLAGVSLAAAPETPAPAAAAAPAPAPAPAEQVLSVPEPGRFKNLFQPFRTDLAALSPDGKYLAYTIRDNGVVSVVVVDVDQPDKLKCRVQVVSDDSATPMMAENQAEKTPGRVNWMRWVNPTRLVVETNGIKVKSAGPGLAWQSWRGLVVGFDADGSNAKLLAGPDEVNELSPPTGAGTVNNFSVARRNNALFDAHHFSADLPGGGQGADGTDPAPEPVVSLTPWSTPEDSGAPPLPDYGASQPRTLRIFDLDPKRPGAVTLIATGAPRDAGSHSVGLFTLDGTSAKLTSLTDDLLLNSRTALLDRQGNIRLTLPNSLLSSLPFHYEYLGAKGANRPHPLDGTAGLSGFTLSADNFFGSRAIPLGFDENPDVLYYASNIGRDTYGIYSVNLATGQPGSLAMENPTYDLIDAPTAAFPAQNTLVFDRYQHQLTGVRYNGALRTTAWLRPEWKVMQAQFEKMFPGRSVEITDWDEAGQRFVFMTQGPADPGGFFLYDAPKNRLLEMVRRAPWLDQKHTQMTLPFSYATADGGRVSGLVTIPQQPRLKPIPMIMLCPDLPWDRVQSKFQSDVQALADMGYVVVQLNGRGAWGLGLKQRQSLTAGYDAAQVEDIAGALPNLGKIFNVNLKRVAIMGRGHGGFIALRAVQDHPDLFRCAIALDAPVNLGEWLEQQKWNDDDVQPQLTRAWLGNAARLEAAPLTRHPELVTKPVLLLNYPGLDGTPRRLPYVSAQNFARAVRSHGGTAEFGDLSTDYMQGLPQAYAATFDRIEAFLNTHVYDFNVKLDALKVVP